MPFVFAIFRRVQRPVQLRFAAYGGGEDRSPSKGLHLPPDIRENVSALGLWPEGYGRDHLCRNNHYSRRKRRMSETMIERVAKAMEAASLGYSMNLTRLVEGVSTYRLTYSDGEVLEFDGTDELYMHVAEKKRRTQARAAIEVLRDPSFEMMEAMFEAMFEAKFTGAEAPMMGAGFEAAVNAALKEPTP